MGLALALPGGRLPSPPAMRGVAHELRLEIHTAPGEVTLSWSVHPQADRYAVRIFAADGTLLLWRETTEARCTLLRSELPPAEQ